MPSPPPNATIILKIVVNSKNDLYKLGKKVSISL